MSDNAMIMLTIECPSCRGTGLYSGVAEDESTAVVCHTCKGSGASIYTYREFSGRQPRPRIRWVYQVNPGTKVGGPDPARFGGMPASAWARGEGFPPKSENREYTCPAWWYQSADYKRKPDWKECRGFGAFSDCVHFPTRARCWLRFDRQQKK